MKLCGYESRISVFKADRSSVTLVIPKNSKFGVFLALTYMMIEQIKFLLIASSHNVQRKSALFQRKLALKQHYSALVIRSEISFFFSGGDNLQRWRLLNFFLIDSSLSLLDYDSFQLSSLFKVLRY